MPALISSLKFGAQPNRNSRPIKPPALTGQPKLGGLEKSSLTKSEDETPDLGRLDWIVGTWEGVGPADGAALGGIHHGRDFASYEDARRMFRLTASAAHMAHLECLENCRVKSLDLAQRLSIFH